ncbi:MAG: sigma-70 family RNA polymerase sigma factor [Bacteroidota bacterium]
MEDTNYLPAILSGDRTALNQMYVKLFPMIRRLILNLGGTEDDAKDIFQDAVIVIYEKAQKPDFKLTSKFSTFLHSVCNNIWLSRQQKKSSQEVTIPEQAKYIRDESAEVDLLQTERGKLFYRSLRQLGDDCQKVLVLFFQKMSMEDIAVEMGYAGEGYARRRKSQCKDRLVELIKNDAAFTELQTA